MAAMGIVALGSGLLAACGGDSDSASTAGPTDSSGTSVAAGGQSDTAAGDEPAGDPATGADGVAPSGDTVITIPIAAGWAEDVAVSHLWKHLLDERGYDVTLTTLDVGPIFDGVANGKYDVFFDTALPVTHQKYWDRYGDHVTDLGPWFDNMQNTITVPDYMDIDSIDQLPEVADKLGKRIVGIDAGAGLTGVTKDSMMPAYGLDDAGWELQESSTAAMLAALKAAVHDHEPVVVTLWHPHWAYSAFPLKDLKDPKGAMGEPDKIHVIGNPDFVEAHPELRDPLENFHLDDDALASLEAATVQDPDLTGSAITEAAGAWAEEHPEVIGTFLK